MELFKASKIVFKELGILEADAKRSSFIRTLVKNVLLVLINGPMLIFVSMLYIYYYHSDELEYSIDTFIVCVGGCNSAIQYLCLRVKVKEIIELVEYFECNVKKVTGDARELYAAAEKRAYKLTMVSIKSLRNMTIMTFGLFPLIDGIYNYYTGNYDERTWYTNAHISVPYERHTIPENVLQQWYICLVCWFYVSINTASLTFLITCHYLIKAAYFHIKAIFKEIDDLVSERGQMNSVAIEMRLQTIINLHIQQTSSAEMLSQIMSGPIFVCITANVICSAAYIFLVESAMQEPGLVMLKACYCLFATSFWMMIYCYYADKITPTLNSIGAAAYETHWYNYPLAYRKYTILVIRRSQMPFEFNGMNMFECNIRTYGAILRLVSSYYLMFRRVNAV